MSAASVPRADRCGQPRLSDGEPCRNAAPCRWHRMTPRSGGGLAVIPAHRGSAKRAWRRSDVRYASARLAHLNPSEDEPEEWDDGPDGMFGA
jgi:hypothetical protein